MGFARQLNSILDWPKKGWESWCFTILRFLWYPLAAEFLRIRREVRATRLVRMVRSYDHSMLQGNRARALQNSIFLYISAECTVFWLDILQRDGIGPKSDRHDAVLASSENMSLEPGALLQEGSLTPKASSSSMQSSS